MNTLTRCPECGADWADGNTCLDHFYMMGMWELDHQLYDVHHLMVLCYHLQHPSLYSQYGLDGAKEMLAAFLDDGITPQAMRFHISGTVDSGVRRHKIKGTPDSHGSYAKPIQWGMVAADVTRYGIDNYYERVQQWAQATFSALRESGNLSKPVNNRSYMR